MNDALTLIYFFIDEFLKCVFGLYIFPGVSVGMLLITTFIYFVLIRFLVAIPRINFRRNKNEKD